MPKVSFDRRMRPTDPIFDVKKQRGAINVGNSWPAVPQTCDLFDRPDSSSLGSDWVEQGGISIVSMKAARAGSSQWAHWFADANDVNQWCEWDVENLSATLQGGLLRVNVTGASFTAYGADWYPAYASHPTGEWRIWRAVGTSAVGNFFGPPIAGTTSPVLSGAARLRFEAFTNGSGNVELNLYEVIAGVPTLRLTVTDSSGSKILTNAKAGFHVGTDPIHTAAFSTVDNWCFGTL